MPTLYIRVLSVAEPLDEGYRIGGEWLILDNEGAVLSRGVTDYAGFSELVESSSGWLSDPANVVVILPSEHVLGVSCEVPGRNVNQIRKALPFVVEEFVTTDIEGMHLAHGGIRSGRPVRCNLVEKGLLESWRACFTEIGIAPGFLVSEAELLPDESDTAYALFDGDHVLIKTGDQAATVDRVNLSFAVAGLAEPRLVVVNGTLSELETAELEGQLEIVQEAANPHTDTTLGFLANRWRTSPDAINLLQGEYTPPRKVSRGDVKWRSVGILAACWLGLAFVSMVAQGWWASQRASDLEDQSLALYRDIFPDDKRVTGSTVRRRAASKLGEAGSGEGAAGFLELLGVVAAKLDESVTLQRVSFNGNKGELGMDVLLQSYDQLERVKDTLVQQGLVVDITGAEQEQAGGVRAFMRLSAGQDASRSAG